MDFQDILAQNGAFGGKIRERVLRCSPQRTRSYFWGLPLLAIIDRAIVLGRIALPRM